MVTRLTADDIARKYSYRCPVCSKFYSLQQWNNHKARSDCSAMLALLQKANGRH